MRLRVCAGLLLLALPMAEPLAAQTMITFEIPVNLTKLHSGVTRIRAYCVISSDAIVPVAGQTAKVRGMVDEGIPVVGGQVVSTLRVVITFDVGELTQPLGKTATYTCELHGSYSQGTGPFSDQVAVTHPLYMKPAPPMLTGTFTW